MVTGIPHNDHKSFSDYGLAIEYWRKYCYRAHTHGTTPRTSAAHVTDANACSMHGLTHVHIDPPVRVNRSLAATVDTSYPTSSISPTSPTLPALIPDPNAKVFFALRGRKNIVFSDRYGIISSTAPSSH